MDLLYVGIPHVCMYTWAEEEITLKIKKSFLNGCNMFNCDVISVSYPNIEKFMH